MDAVNQDGSALEFASEGLRKDKDIVIDAVKQNGVDLQFESKYLRKDMNIMMNAVKQHGHSSLHHRMLEMTGIL